jgi:predicted DNA-binding protein YlxM (UPF0122 family)
MSAASGSHVTRSAAADRLRLTEQWMYDAECALHLARQTRVDAWIRAAADRLHEAITANADAVRAARSAHAA